MRLGPCLLIGGRTLQGARAQLAYFCAAPVAGFYSAVDSLQIAREQLDISRQQIRMLRSSPPSFSALSDAQTRTETAPSSVGYASEVGRTEASSEPYVAPQLEHEIGQAIEYRGKTIRVVDTGYLFGGTTYSSLEAAKVVIDDDANALRAGPPQPKTGQSRIEPPLTSR